MKIKELMMELNRMLNDVIVVEKPDHPYSFDTPDILVGGQGYLTGLYIKKRNESDIRFLTRLIYSRLAFPSNMRTIYLASEQNENNNLCNFDEIIDIHNVKDIVSLVRDKSFHGKSQMIPPKLKSYYKNVQHLNYYYSLKSLGLLTDSNEFDYERLNNQKNKKKEWDPKKDLEKYKSKNNIRDLYCFKEMIVSNKEVNNKKFSFDQISPYSNFTLLEELNIDCGVPYVIEKRIKAIDIDIVPIYKYDPLKYVKALSLYGWVMTNFEDINEFEVLESKLRRKSFETY